MSKALAIDIARAFLGEMLGDKAPAIDTSFFAQGELLPDAVILDDDIFSTHPATCALRLVSQALNTYTQSQADELPHKEALILEKAQEEFHELFWNSFWLNPENRKHGTLGLRRVDDRIVLVGFTRETKISKDAIMKAMASIEARLADASPEERVRMLKEALAQIMPGVSMTVLGFPLGPGDLPK